MLNGFIRKKGGFRCQGGGFRAPGGGFVRCPSDDGLGGSIRTSLDVDSAPLLMSYQLSGSATLETELSSPDPTLVAGTHDIESSLTISGEFESTSLPAVADMLVDFDAALDVTHTGDGTLVTAWDSQVGSIVATAPAGKEPTYIESGSIAGLPCIRTAGAEVMTLSAALRPTSGPMTVMIVAEDTAPDRTSFRFFISSWSAPAFICQSISSGNVGYRTDGTYEPVGLSLAGDQVLTWTLESGAGSAYRARQKLNADDDCVEVAWDGTCQLFGYNAGSAAYADVYRILVWDKVLSESELNQAWAYIHSVYGVAPSLPGQQTMEASARFSGPTNVSSTRKRWSTTSDYLGSAQNIDVLLPASWSPDTDRRWPVLFVLPEYAGPPTGVFDGMSYVDSDGFADHYDCIVVMPSYSTEPWYGDHGSDTAKQHRTYLMEVVLPFIEANYMGSTERQGRMLIGYSKSGVGAISLIAEFPDVFGFALSWDSPLMMQTSDWPYANYSIDVALGTEAAWTAMLPRYLIAANPIGSSYNRILLLGRDAGSGDAATGTIFGDDPGTPGRYLGAEHTAGFSALLTSLSVNHYIDNTVEYAHASGWSTAWLIEALVQLVVAKNAGDAVDPPADSNAQLGTP